MSIMASGLGKQVRVGQRVGEESRRKGRGLGIAAVEQGGVGAPESGRLRASPGMVLISRVSFLAAHACVDEHRRSIHVGLLISKCKFVGRCTIAVEGERCERVFEGTGRTYVIELIVGVTKMLNGASLKMFQVPIDSPTDEPCSSQYITV